MQVCIAKWILTSVTAIPARMVPHVKMLPILIYVSVLNQNLIKSHWVGATVIFSWLAVSSTNVNMTASACHC